MLSFQEDFSNSFIAALTLIFLVRFVIPSVRWCLEDGFSSGKWRMEWSGGQMVLVITIKAWQFSSNSKALLISVFVKASSKMQRDYF